MGIPKIFLAAFALAGAAAIGTLAAAGPPYVTDDPEPTELGRWEIYAFAAGEGAHREYDGAAGLDLNYGALKNIQLTATLPIDFAREQALGIRRTRVGAGNVELGLKYRFLNREDVGFQVALFPRLILPTAARRFGTGRLAVLLPVWAQKDIGPWSAFGGGGYTINPGAGNRDFWQAGLALTRTLSERLSLGGEVTWAGADEVGAHSTVGLDAGGIYHLGGPYSLLLSGGPFHEHRGTTGWRGYAALGLAF